MNLEYVETIEDIRESLRNFNSEAANNSELTRSLLSHTSYWVWDPNTRNFGPSKFVGLKRMNLLWYGDARNSDHLGAAFNGHATQERIASVIGESYQFSEAFSKALDKWGRSLVPDNTTAHSTVFDRVDRSKWKFITLPKPDSASGNWTKGEVGVILRDYFAMLLLELEGTHFSKTAHRTRLLKKLNGRSKGSVEFKHCNISAVLDEQGLPYISGYKPRDRYQKSLKSEVLTFIASQPLLENVIQSKLVESPQQALDGSKFRIEEIEEAAPKAVAKLHSSGKKVARFTNWEKVTADGKALGNLGEKFVFELERRHLGESGRSDLAQKIVWVSKEEGDGLGYDIRSWDHESGKVKCIEVKTTNGGISTPFIISANELAVSNAIANDYWIYRIFGYASGKPKLFRINGPLSKRLHLEPIQYRAVPK